MFPYADILKKAYNLTLKKPWLWVFGFFIMGSVGFNLVTAKLVFPEPQSLNHFQGFREAVFDMQTWVARHPEWTTIVLIAMVLIFLTFLVLSAWARSAVIWSAGQSEKEPAPELYLKMALKKSKKFVWRIVMLQFSIALVFMIFIATFALPVYYLFTTNAFGQASFLALLGVVIFIPGAVILAFIHLFAPIFITLYDRGVKESVVMSFQLATNKLKECLLLSAFLIGLEFIFTIALIFSLILIALPVALLTFLVLFFGFLPALNVLLAGAILISLFYVIVLKAGFAVFQNVVWVFALSEMVGTIKLEAPEEVMAPEPI